ncbi:unnamed protein product [Jaminaea pallidilutea]
MCGISLTATEAANVNAACAFFLAATWRPHNFPRQDKTDQLCHVVLILGAECLTSSAPPPPPPPPRQAPPHQ